MTAPRPYSAAREYKEIVADFTAAAEALKERDSERVEQLNAEIYRLDEEMVRTGERIALTRLVAHVQWEAALEALWVESWMTFRRRPDPDLSADPAEFARYDAELELRAAELQEAVRRRRFGLRRR